MVVTVVVSWNFIIRRVAVVAKTVKLSFAFFVIANISFQYTFCTTLAISDQCNDSAVLKSTVSHQTKHECTRTECIHLVL